MKLCKNEETRKRYNIAYTCRNKENVPLMEQAVKIRRQAAKLLGFKNHAAFVLDVKMAKTVEAVESVRNTKGETSEKEGSSDYYV